MKLLVNTLRLLTRVIFAFFSLGVLMSALAYVYLAPGLPTIENIKDMRLQVPLRVYARDGRLIAEFGEKRRIPMAYEEFPEKMINAVLAAEDNRFFEHPGVDYQGLLRAFIHLAKTGDKGQGGSTITMQVARNFFLSSEKTYLRKLNEIFLALKIERELTKQQIIELYLNKIYLGNRAYGVAAAARIYYGKPVTELTTAEMAMIAGLPKAPSRYNPIINSQRAVIRRGYVLGRMHALDYINDEDYQAAIAEPDNASLHRMNTELEAPYVAEMVRAHMVEKYGDDAYTEGFNVYTTIDFHLQEAANNALRNALTDYEQRHGYRGAEDHVTLKDEETDDETANSLLQNVFAVGGLYPAVVLKLNDQSVNVFVQSHGRIEIPWEGLSWARRYIDTNEMGAMPERASQILKKGDIIRVQKISADLWRLSQIPDVSGALVSLNPDNGAIIALQGGFDFYHSKFNRAVQAERQPGSNFKPFIYSAALDKGFTAASIINDAPVVFDDPGLESAWRPENYSGEFFGPTRLRVALTKSRNLVSIRLLRSIGITHAINYTSQFGFNVNHLPRDLSLALGSGAVTPISIARGYAIFANGGYLVEPYFIERVEDMDGNVVFRNNLPVVCRTCEEKTEQTVQDEEGATNTGVITTPLAEPEVNVSAEQSSEPIPARRVIDPRTVYIMTSIMRDVIQFGTGKKALELGRNDLAGKTGTTNDQRDAWFSGFNRDVVTTVWVGFDRTQPLGNYETGAKAALPMWVDYMREALKGVPEKPLERPDGLVTVRIDPETGLLANTGDENAIFETFRAEEVPTKKSSSTPIYANTDEEGNMTEVPRKEPEQLF